MLEQIIEKTNQYIEEMPKKERKKYGQFFTSIETARYMAGLFVIPEQTTVTLLDAGAGSGILTCAMIERLDKIEDIKEIIVTCYENDEVVTSFGVATTPRVGDCKPANIFSMVDLPAPFLPTNAMRSFLLIT